MQKFSFPSGSLTSVCEWFFDNLIYDENRVSIMKHFLCHCTKLSLFSVACLFSPSRRPMGESGVCPQGLGFSLCPGSSIWTKSIRM